MRIHTISNLFGYKDMIFVYLFQNTCNNRVVYQNTSSSGDGRESSQGEDYKDIHLAPNQQCAATNPFILESNSSYQPLITTEQQQQANLQESHEPLKKTTPASVKGTNAGCKESEATQTKPPQSMEPIYEF